MQYCLSDAGELSAGQAALSAGIARRVRKGWSIAMSASVHIDGLTLKFARRSSLGELVPFDGSPHAWFEDRGERCCLMNMVDDATGTTLAFLWS